MDGFLLESSKSEKDALPVIAYTPCGQSHDWDFTVSLQPLNMSE